jgi:hypothetical protein
MGAQEKRILSNSRDTRIVDSRSTCNYDKSHGKYSLAITLREEKPAKKEIRSSLTDRIPQKPV